MNLESSVERIRRDSEHSATGSPGGRAEERKKEEQQNGKLEVGEEEENGFSRCVCVCVRVRRFTITPHVCALVASRHISTHTHTYSHTHAFVLAVTV